ncbi:hypothetical protein C8J57DRAFT_1090271 [Mycena rebaudengoi]|nr:hypothetical protein C8J57DRAFT_1090271 [Mycena rebaudengoi]
MDVDVGGKKRKAGGKGEGRKKKRKRASRFEDDDGVGDEEHGGDDEEEEQDSNNSEEVVRTQRVQRKKPTPKVPAAREWAVVAKSELSESKLGLEWDQLVQLWWDREQATGFGVSVSENAQKRPNQVKNWVQRARSKAYEPEIPDHDTFREEWWTWWLNINPAWRKTAVPMLRTSGSLEFVDFTGRNRFLNVLMCLKWWGDASKGSSERWKEGVKDVVWVLRGLNR